MSVELARAGSTIAFYHQGTSPYALITFIDGGGSVYFDGQKYWGREFVEKNDITAIGIVTTVKNWYDPDEMAAVAEIVRPVLVGHSEIITYGTSMGGYGAIKFSRMFGATRTIAVSPQSSIEPDRVASFDSRYHTFYDGRAGRLVEAPDVSGRTWIIYDPLYLLDAGHVPPLLGAAPSATTVRMRYMDHFVISLFVGSAQVLALIAAVLRDDVPGFTRLAHQRRKASSQYFFSLAAKAIQRHPNAVATFLQSNASSILSPHRHARLWFLVHLRRGDAEQALAIAASLPVTGRTLINMQSTMFGEMLRHGHDATAQRLVAAALARSPGSDRFEKHLKRLTEGQKRGGTKLISELAELAKPRPAP